MIEISVAYGLPASGKTTLLRQLNVNYIDLDKFSVNKIKEVIESLDEGKYAIDFLLRNPNDFINYVQLLDKNIMLKIYVLNTPRGICKKRDLKRPLYRQSKKLIENMKIEKFINLDDIVYVGRD